MALLELLQSASSEELLEWLSDDEIGGYVGVVLAGRKDDLFAPLEAILLRASDVRQRKNAAFVFYQSAACGRMTERDALLLASAARDDTSGEVRLRCVGALGVGEAKASQAVSMLVDVVNSDADMDVLFTAARSLGQIDCTRFDQVSDRLVALLSSPDAEVRRDAACAIGWYAKHAEEALPVLRQMAGDSDERVRVAAGKTAAEIAENVQGRGDH